MKKVLLFLSALALWSCNSSKTPDIEKIDFSEEQVAEYWQTGKTLPAGVAIQYQPELINMPQDKGYNVLIDVSHQCSFASLWGLGGRLHELGYRSITNQASVNTVLDPEGFCRIRIPYDTENKIYPFAWYPNFNYNVIITEQTDLNAQHYTDKEIKAMVDFVKDGGALVIGAVPVGDQEKLDAWTLNQLVGEFGAKLTTESDKYRGMDYAVVNVNDDIVFEMELIKQVEINIDYILYLIVQMHGDHAKDKEIRLSIQKAINSSPDLRNKKDLIEDFIDQLTPEKDVNDDWHKFVKQQEKEQLDKIISEENLKPKETYEFVSQSFKNGEIEETGTAITRILPPIPLFSKNKENDRGKKKKSVIAKLKAFFEKFFDVSGGTFKAE